MFLLFVDIDSDMSLDGFHPRTGAEAVGLLLGPKIELSLGEHNVWIGMTIADLFAPVRTAPSHSSGCYPHFFSRTPRSDLTRSKRSINGRKPSAFPDVHAPLNLLAQCHYR